MKHFRQNNDFGISWGVPGFRIGKSQYGTWWISIGLPLGFRITKNISPITNPFSLFKRSPIEEQTANSPKLITSKEQSQHLTENQKLLEKIRNQSD